MQTPRSIAVASLTAVALLGACSNGGSSSSSTTKAPASLASALLGPADVPGSTGSPPSPDSTDLTTCFPGNPLGAKADPSEVKGQDLSLDDPGGAVHQFSSSARRATPEQATALVNGFASPTGAACAANAFKAEISNDPKPPKVDPSGLSSTSSSADVGEGGALLSLSGTISSGGSSVPASIDLLLFHRGPVLVVVSAATFGGANAGGQAVELARTVAGRLPA